MPQKHPPARRAVSVCVVISILSMSAVTSLSPSLVNEQVSVLGFAAGSCGSYQAGIGSSMPEVDHFRRLTGQAGRVAIGIDAPGGEFGNSRGLRNHRNADGKPGSKLHGRLHFQGSRVGTHDLLADVKAEAKAASG